MRWISAFPLVRNRLLSLFFVVGVLTIAGCKSASTASLSSALTTPQGVQVEKLFPFSTSILLKVGANDAAQVKAFNLLMTSFPQSGFDHFSQSILTQFNQDLSKYGMTYEADVKPFQGENPQFLVSMGPDLKKDSNGQPSSQNSFQLEFALPLVDTTKADAFMAKLVEKGDYKKEDYHGNSLYLQEARLSYIARIKDVLLMTNRLDFLKEAVDHQNTNDDTLLNNPVYQKALARVPSSLGFVYLDLKNYVNFLKQQNAVMNADVKALSSSFNTPLFDALEGEVFAISAEEKGFRIAGTLLGDDEKLKKAGINFSDLQEPRDPYLYQKVPTDDALMYSEHYNLEKILEYDFKIWDGVELTKNIHPQIQKFFTQQGLDFDQDIMPMLDKGASFVMADNSGFLPSIDLYLDVSSQPDKAQKFLAKLGANLTLGVNLLKLRLGENAAALSVEDALFQGSKVHVIRFKLDKLSPSIVKSIPPVLLKTPIELWYGITADNIAFVAFHPHFDADYGVKSLAKNTHLQAARTALGGKYAGFFYLSPNAFMGYVDHFVDFAAQSGQLQADQEKNYQLVKSYILPLRSFVFGVTPVSAGETKLEGFIMVGK